LIKEIVSVQTMEVVIRTAVKEDCKAIRSLIQELAVYEKMPDGPKISAQVLEEDGFGDNKFFHCLLAEIDSQSVGFVLYNFSYSTWEGKMVYMDDLYVQPGHRSKGIGTKLWKALVKHALDIGCSRCHWNVLDWNKPSIDYYKRQGAVDLSEKEGWLAFRMTKETMKEFVSK